MLDYMTEPAPTPTPTPAPVPAGPRRRPVDGRSRRGRRLGVCLAAAAAALTIGQLLPLVSPLLIALVLGAVAANLPTLAGHLGDEAGDLDKLLLRVGVVLLGLQIALSDLATIGVAGLAVVALTVVVTFTATHLLGRALGLSPALTALIAAGFSICGAAAIAAVESSVRAKAKEVALAIAMVTVWGSLMIAALPPLATTIGLSDSQAAVWAGASIHEVAQVVATASLIGGSAVVSLATTVKLARVMLLAPVHAASARIGRTGVESSAPRVPWFVTGFLIAVAVRTTDWLPDQALTVGGWVTQALLAAAMFGLGTGLVLRQLWPIQGRVLLVSAGATIVAAGTGLASTVALV